MPARVAVFILFCMEATSPRPVRLCEHCGLAVGTYEPAVFVFAHQIIRSSRAASPGLAAKPDCRLSHSACFEAHGRRAQATSADRSVA